MKFDYDVIVVGGGPAGSTAARFSAQAGLKTLLIEKERLPRYKACGGCLSPKALRLLDFDLRSLVENTIYAARFTYRLQDPLIIRSKEPMGFMVRRDRFDQFLVNKAREKGVDVWEGERAVRVGETAAGLEVGLAGGERQSCEYLIGADGAGNVASRSFPELRSSDDGMGFGLECEIPFDAVTHFPQEDLSVVHLDFGRIPSGYGWVFPKKEGLSVGIGGIFAAEAKTNPRQHFDAFLKELGYIDETRLGRIVGHSLPCFYDMGQKICYGNVLLTGDAGRLIDPLTGEGIYYAIQSGRLAAEAIVLSKVKGMKASEAYQDSVSFLLEELRWARHVSQIIYGLTKLSYRTLKHYPELGEFCVHVLAGETNYKDFVGHVKERITKVLKGRFVKKIRNAVS